MSNQRAFQEGARCYRAGMQAAKYDYMRGAHTVKSNFTLRLARFFGDILQRV